MNDNFAELKAFCKAEDMNFDQLNDSVLLLRFAGDHGRFDTYVEAVEGQPEIRVETLCPVTVPEAKRLAVTELLCRINCRCCLGAFRAGYGGWPCALPDFVDVRRGLPGPGSACIISSGPIGCCRTLLCHSLPRSFSGRRRRRRQSKPMGLLTPSSRSPPRRSMAPPGIIVSAACWANRITRIRSGT